MLEEEIEKARNALCDCSTCRPGESYIMCGNPPHGWFRLARMRLCKAEDSYTWCCLYCHALVFDQGVTWHFLGLHQMVCAAKIKREMKQ